MEPAAFVLSSLPPPPARLLEVGCGAGELARALDAAGYDVVAVDPRAPEGAIFRRVPLEQLADEGPFDVAVARYSLHHMHDLDAAVDRIAALLRPGGKVVVDEFGWDLVDAETAAWIAQQTEGASAEAGLAEGRPERERLHPYPELRRTLDARFDERSFAWQPYLHDCLGRPDLERAEQDAVARGAIRPIGFRYAGLRR